MSNAIRQHIPDFCEGFEKITTAFDTIEELLAIEWVKKFSEPIEGLVIVDVLHPDKPVEQPKKRKPFHRYSISHNDRTLMAEYDEGREWWVVGFLREPVEGLPEWEPKEKDG